MNMTTADEHHERARAALAQSEEESTVTGSQLHIARAQVEALLAISAHLGEMNARQEGLLE